MGLETWKCQPGSTPIVQTVERNSLVVAVVIMIVDSLDTLIRSSMDSEPASSGYALNQYSIGPFDMKYVVKYKD